MDLWPGVARSWLKDNHIIIDREKAIIGNKSNQTEKNCIINLWWPQEEEKDEDEEEEEPGFEEACLRLKYYLKIIDVIIGSWSNTYLLID